jgi:hypothetical protein
VSYGSRARLRHVSRRTRIVAAQAAVVAVLVSAVYLWLLGPEESGPLHGIQGPPGGGPAQRHAGPGHSRSHDRRGAPHRGRHGPKTPAAGGNGPVVAASTLPSGLPPSSERRGLGTTPAGNQYLDTASALQDKVGRVPLFAP